VIHFSLCNAVALRKNIVHGEKGLEHLVTLLMYSTDDDGSQPFFFVVLTKFVVTTYKNLDA